MMDIIYVVLIATIIVYLIFIGITISEIKQSLYRLSVNNVSELIETNRNLNKLIYASIEQTHKIQVTLDKILNNLEIQLHENRLKNKQGD